MANFRRELTARASPPKARAVFLLGANHVLRTASSRAVRYWRWASPYYDVAHWDGGPSLSPCWGRSRSGGAKSAAQQPLRDRQGCARQSRGFLSGIRYDDPGDNRGRPELTGTPHIKPNWQA
jgi:hypothetical protein